MTYKMLLVDDEPIILRGLRLTIPWETINVEVIDIAQDGEEAIEKIKEHGNIEIVITDVKMTKVDGLQLANFLYNHFPHIRTIILSGYDEFEYAQQAIKLGVKDYLLKPVKIAELVEKVKLLANEIELEKHQRKKMHETRLRNSIMEQISDIQGGIITALDSSNPTKVYPFISLHQNYMRKINNLSDGKFEEFLVGWEKTIENRLNEFDLSSYSFFTEKNILLTCVYDEERQQMSAQMLQNLKWDDDLALRFIPFDKWIPVENLKTVYPLLVAAVKFLPFTDDFCIVVSDQLCRATEPAYPHELEKKVIHSIVHKEDENVYLLVNELFQYFSSNKFFLEEVIEVCRNLFNQISQHYESLGGKKVHQWDFHFKETINVHLYNSYELLAELFYQDLSIIRKEQSELESIDKQDLLIDHAKEYIHEFYGTNIKVHEVADIINITPNYFSSLFKRKTGVNFNEYVNQLRVNEAKVLLVETPFRVSEISEQVGFLEYKYFVGVFKKHTGMTPTNYRKFRSLQSVK